MRNAAGGEKQQFYPRNALLRAGSNSLDCPTVPYRSKPNAAPPALVRALDRCSKSGSYRRAGEGFVLAEAPSALSCCDDRRASSVPGYFDMIWRNSCTAPGRSPVLTSVWPFKYIALRVFGLSGYLSSTALSALSALS